jgi:hypothetical protein
MTAIERLVPIARTASTLPGPETVDISDQVSFVLGAPRSGTTWLAKVLDSHPDVLYRHEPDIALQDYSFPTLCEESDVPQYVGDARRYLDRLLDVRTLKTAGGFPLFPKRYRSAPATAARVAVLLALGAAQQLPALRLLAGRFPVPDLVDFRHAPNLRVVVKSVSALGRAGLLVQAMPRSRFVLILRHPCGQVASMLRGSALNKFEESLETGSGLITSTARRYGLTRKAFTQLSLPEQHAWDWAIMNEFAIDQLEGLGRMKIVLYEEFCAEPRERAREIFDYLNIDWAPQTERFLERSTTYSGRDRYYQVYKNTQEAMNRWRTELRPEVQDAILAIARQTRVGQMFA